MSQRRAVVAGAGGFIGHHMVNYLKDRGYWVRGVDIKAAEYEPSAADEFLLHDPGRVFFLVADLRMPVQVMPEVDHACGHRVEIRKKMLIRSNGHKRGLPPEP